VRGTNSTNYALFIGDSNGVNVQSGSTAFTSNGTWARYSVSYNEASGAVRRPVIRKTSGADQGTFYVDGIQVEVGSLTTYIDGDHEGCYWLGAAHNSQSTRSGTYRGGGSAIPLQSLGWIIDEEPGVGMPPLETTAQSFALQPGADFQRQRAMERSFS